MTTAEQRTSYEQLVDHFKATGWRVERRPADRASATRAAGEVVCIYRRLRTGDEGADSDPQGKPLCCTNHSLQIMATIHDTLLPNGQHYRTVAFDITGEYRRGLWCRLEVYSVSWDQAVEQHEDIRMHVEAAWDAICDEART